MRTSTFVVVVVACMALLTPGVLASTFRPAGANSGPHTDLVESPAAPASSVDLSPKALCVAKCGATAALCALNCPPKATMITCREQCVVDLGACTAECLLSESDSEPAPVPAVIEAPVVKEAAPVELSPKAACLAKCTATAALCELNCPPKATMITCREQCAVNAGSCAAECILSSTVDSSNVEATFAAQREQDASDAKLFAQFKDDFAKKYESDELEAHRFSIFQSNLRRAEELNVKNPSAKFGVTQFSDLHPQEFQRQYLTFRPAVGDSALLRMRHGAAAVSGGAASNGSVPTAYDWRKPDQGRPVAVTAVKDQGQCGSCWAFSATEEVESMWILAGRGRQILAPEQTVDCDTVDQGCNGGDTVSAYAYMEGAGVMTERSYPYQAGDSGSAGECAYNASQVVAKIKGFTYATPGCSDACDAQNEDVLKSNLYKHGPVSICVDASPWQTYVGGILTPDSGCNHGYNQLDHCVQLVGYGVDASSGTQYWSVRNSWATSWGEAGYIRLSYGQNTCGVADEATQVTVA